MTRDPRARRVPVAAIAFAIGLASLAPQAGLARRAIDLRPASPEAGSGRFDPTGQLLLGLAQSRGIALGDLDGDHDVDAFVTVFSELDPSGTRMVGAANRILLGDGAGGLVDNGQRLGGFHSEAVALGDLDGDGDLDAFVANSGYVDQTSGSFVPEPNLVWRNAGAGGMTDTGQRLGPGPSRGVALGDLDGDGDLDAFVANGADPGRVPPGQPDRVWLNLGNGAFIDSGARLGSADSADVALADLDRDGDLDAFVATDGGPDAVWLNDGRAHFRGSGQAIGNGHTWNVGLADLDGDGDVDAYLAGAQDLGALATPQPSEPDRVWLNTGSAGFVDSGQSLGADFTIGLALGDIDDDGDVDAVTAGIGPANRVWLNQGLGRFAPSGQSLGSGNAWGLALADLDGDLDLDFYQSKPGQYDRVWLNADTPPSPSPTRTATATRTPTPSPSPSATATLVPGVTPSITPTPSRTATPSPTASPSPTLTPPPPPTPTRTSTPTPTPSPSVTPSATASPTASASPSASATLAQGVTPSATLLPSVTPTATATGSASPSPSTPPSATGSATASPNPSATPTASPSPSASPTSSPSPSPTATPGPGTAPIPTHTPSLTPTPSQTPSPTTSPTASATQPIPTRTRRPTPTYTPGPGTPEIATYTPSATPEPTTPAPPSLTPAAVETATLPAGVTPSVTPTLDPARPTPVGTATPAREPTPTRRSPDETGTPGTPSATELYLPLLSQRNALIGPAPRRGTWPSAGR